MPDPPATLVETICRDLRFVNDAPTTVANLKDLFRPIAVHFNTHASIGIISVQAHELAMRFSYQRHVVARSLPKPRNSMIEMASHRDAVAAVSSDTSTSAGKEFEENTCTSCFSNAEVAQVGSSAALGRCSAAWK